MPIQEKPRLAGTHPDDSPSTEKRKIKEAKAALLDQLPLNFFDNLAESLPAELFKALQKIILMVHESAHAASVENLIDIIGLCEDFRSKITADISYNLLDSNLPDVVSIKNLLLAPEILESLNEVQEKFQKVTLFLVYMIALVSLIDIAANLHGAKEGAQDYIRLIVPAAIFLISLTAKPLIDRAEKGHRQDQMDSISGFLSKLNLSLYLDLFPQFHSIGSETEDRSQSRILVVDYENDLSNKTKLALHDDVAAAILNLRTESWLELVKLNDSFNNTRSYWIHEIAKSTPLPPGVPEKSVAALVFRAAMEWYVLRVRKSLIEKMEQKKIADAEQPDLISSTKSQIEEFLSRRKNELAAAVRNNRSSAAQAITPTTTSADQQ